MTSHHSDAVPPTRLEVGGVAASGEVSQQTQPSDSTENSDIRPDTQEGTTLPRLVGYLRVSSQEQANSGAGIAAQRSAIGAGHGSRYWVARYEVDEGLSASTMERPGFRAALDSCTAGEVDGIIVAKLDRLSRSVIHFGQILERSRSEGWAIVALDLGVDTTTAGGELVANVLMTVAQWERRVIGERTKAALAEKRAQGIVGGRRSTIPDAVRREITTLRASGMTLSAIAATLNERGIPTGQGGAEWRHSSVRAVLTRPSSAGTSRPSPS